MKNIRKNLSNFDTRIVSTMRASPGSFAKILGNDLLYQDFRFDIHHKYTESKQEKQRIDKSQSIYESVYIELAKSKGDIESRQENYRQPEQSYAVNKDNIKIVTLYDKENNRFIICEKTYELQKYYIISIDEERIAKGLTDLVEITSYVVVQVNMGTK